MKHWLEQGLSYSENVEKLEDAIIMVLDPDMILLRPLTYDFTGSNVLLHNANGRRVPLTAPWKVMHGRPRASHYVFGDGPFKLDLAHVFANHTDSPALRVSQVDAYTSYAGGPPYMATGRDMFAIVTVWCDLVPGVHSVYPQLLGEMFGWSLAAAHLDLPHYLADSFMVSDLDSGREGWPLIDDLDQADIWEGSSSKRKTEKLPYVLHYCQMYWIGDWLVSKYTIGSSFFSSCEHPLLREPPKDTGPVGAPRGVRKRRIRPTTLKRERFMICQLVLRLNDAVAWRKNKTCDKDPANYEKSHMLDTL